MLKKFREILFIAIIFIAAGCPYLVESVDLITIQNYSNDTIRYYASYIYPDTSMSNSKPRLIRINPQNFGFLDSKKDWEKVLTPPNDTVSIFFLSESVVNTYDWDEVRNKYLILKRYDLSLDDLKLLKWTIHYPPTEEMKDMKMYPPYGSE